VESGKSPLSLKKTIMVTITNYTPRINQQGEKFFALTLQGGVSMVQSKESGNFYATANTTSVTSTFDEQTCKSLIGQKMPGAITKVQCEPYLYVIKDTGEEITISHRWVYVPDQQPQLEEAVFEHHSMASV
jgi:hypothetical protein